MTTHQEIALQVAIAQRNEAWNAALNAATEAHLQRERADGLQKELDAMKAKDAKKKPKTQPPV